MIKFAFSWHQGKKSVIIYDMRERFRKKLAELMDLRRSDLGLRWIDVAHISGLTTQTLREVRQGTSHPRSTTSRAIEKALGWEAGSVDAILKGDQPTLSQNDPEPLAGTVSALLHNVALVRRQLGDDAARALIAGALAQPYPDEERKLQHGS